MALKSIMLRRQLERKKTELAALLEMDADFQRREADLTAAIEEAETDEQQAAVSDEVAAYETEAAAHAAAKENLTREIAELEAELDAAEKPPVVNNPAAVPDERSAHNSMNTYNIRSLPVGRRAFDALTSEQRTAIVAQNDVKEFLTRLRSCKGQTRALSGGDLTIPVVFLDMISENMYRYSKLLNRIRIRDVNGQARQPIAAVVPEAVWTEQCGNLNELSYLINQVVLDGFKVGGFIPVCNSLLEDSDVNLASWVVEMMSESIGLALDKAILYGKGSAYKMPLGIVTRLAQQSKPAGYPTAAPEWVDLHTTNIKSIAANLTGAAFWAALMEASTATFTKYNRGEMFWAMNSKTYGLLKSKAITFTASGDVVANIFGFLPIVTGDVDILEFMPDGDIVGGYGDLYLLGRREGMVIGMDDVGYTNRVQDQTLFFGKMRADGQPAISGAFVAINIQGNTPTTAVTFAGDAANTVSGILLPSAATVAGTGSIQLNAVLQPFGVDGEITWTSATTSKATVSSTGLVTGVSSGTSVISASCAGYTANCTVTVTT